MMARGVAQRWAYRWWVACALLPGMLSGMPAHAQDAAGHVTVRFSYRDPDATQVHLAGEFNNWSNRSHPMTQGPDGVWYRDVMLASGEYAYKFVVDGNWILDPANAQTKLVDGIENSLLITAQHLVTPAGKNAEVVHPSQARRVWTARSGAQIEATFVRQEGAYTVLRKAGGKLTRVPTAQLSESDLAFLRSTLSARPAPGPAPAAGAAAAEGEPGTKTGRFTIQFAANHPLSMAKELWGRFRQNLPTHVDGRQTCNLKDESFEVYVPPKYQPGAGFGLLVWIPDGEVGWVRDDWQAVLDKHRLIWVSANKSGNEHDIEERRAPLALDATYNMLKLYRIHPDRVYLGGGRAVSRMAFHFGDQYEGAILTDRVDYWDEISVPGKANFIWKARLNKPIPKYLGEARKHGRYVFMVGADDVGKDQLMATYDRGYRKDLKHTLLLEMPGLEYGPPPAEWLEKAIAFLEKPRS